MSRATQTEIRLRLVIDAPVAGVVHSLQDAKNHPVDAKKSTGAALVFEVTVRIDAGPKFFGEYVRREGPARRFVYIAIGQQAGDATSPWSRRMKIDIHTIAQPLLDQAMKGKILEVTIAGTGKDGSPACATVAPVRAWRVG